MSAHNMLISEGQKSAANVMARLAVVPMVQVISTENAVLMSLHCIMIPQICLWHDVLRHLSLL